MKEPAIVLITADQLRKDALSCYGNDIIQTPNLDNLASKAVKFERAYSVSPWCLPSRCAILTGLYPHNSGAYSNFRKCELSSDIPNLFTVLKKGGYTSSVVGKCHFAPVPYSEVKPDESLPYKEFRDYYLSLGIDHLDLQDDKQVSVWFRDDYTEELDAAGHLKSYRDCVWSREKKKVFSFPAPAKWHPDNWVGNKAVKYIEGFGEGNMFMWVSFSGPHFPFDAPADYYERVNEERLRNRPRRLIKDEFADPSRLHYSSFRGKNGIEGGDTADGNAESTRADDFWFTLQRNYYANVAQIDDQIGRILRAIERRFGDNALIIFTADHGEMLGNHGFWGKNNCFYEDVLNVPLIVKYPRESGGEVTNAMVMLTDIMATCTSVAGLSAVESDGADLRETVKAGGREYVFAEGEGFLTVSDGRMKYVHVKKPNMEHYELLDLNNDPDEFHNVITNPAHAHHLSTLQKTLINHLLTKTLP